MRVALALAALLLASAASAQTAAPALSPPFSRSVANTGQPGIPGSAAVPDEQLRRFDLRRPRDPARGSRRRRDEWRRKALVDLQGLLGEHDDFVHEPRLRVDHHGRVAQPLPQERERAERGGEWHRLEEADR